MGLWHPEDLFRLPILPQNVGHASSLNRQTRATWCGPYIVLVLQNHSYHETRLILSQEDTKLDVSERPVNMLH